MFLKKIKLNSKSLIGFLYLIPLLVMIILFNIVPLIQSIDASFTIRPYSNNFLITQRSLNNYKEVLNDSYFWEAIKNSTAILFIATFISFIIAFVLAYVIESLILKSSKNIFLNLIYSQFFLSSFAIGFSFLVLFGEKNIFFRILNLNDLNFRFGKINIIWYYILFQIWRSLPFNTILFAATINKANRKYYKLIKLDNLSFFNKVKDIYFVELKNTIFVIMLTNFVFAFLLYPGAILDTNFDLKLYHGHTVASYILERLGIPRAVQINQGQIYSSSILVLIYIFFLAIVWNLLRPKFIKKLYLIFKKVFGVFYAKKNI